jgi:DNA-binding beta-propeller fold protein YncE
MIPAFALTALLVCAPQDGSPAPFRETFAFEWVPGWAQLGDLSLGNTHGCMVWSEAGHLYVNTDSENAMVVFNADGEVVKTWGKQLAGGLHGMCIRKEGQEEFLYLSHLNRHEVLKTTLDGEVIWTLGYPATSGLYTDAGQYKPTGVAVGPDGSIYVADGYGQNWVHQFDRNRNYVRSFGGRGDQPGQFVTCHGIWLDERSDPPTLLIADRENHRLQSFDLQGNFLAVHTPGLRRPCSVYLHGDTVAVADLAGRVSLLDGQNRLIAHLCDNPDPAKRAQNGVPRDQWADGQFLSPHSVCWDPNGNLYVMDWNRLGRISKLARLR